MSILYFAYGSNMDFNRLKQRNIIFELIGKAIISDYMLCFNKSAYKKIGVGYANVMPQKNKLVEGLLFEIQNIEILDKYEGYPKHYRKETIDVTIDNERVPAIIYIAQENKINNSLKPEKEYINHLLSAKEYLSKECFDFLKNTNTID